MTEMKTEANVPAFPSNPDSQLHLGMTLRDYFAAQAMQGLVSNLGITGMETARAGAHNYAHICYLFADAMLKARKD
jgi:hypothetical protein